MKLSVGTHSLKPVFEATVPMGGAEALSSRPGFDDLVDQVLSDGTVRISQVDKDIHHAFLLRKLGRENISKHEQKLGHIIKLLDWLSLAPNVGAEDDAIKLNIDDAPALNGYFLTGIELKLPHMTTEKRIQYLTGNVMRHIARDIRHGGLGLSMRDYRLRIGARMNMNYGHSVDHVPEQYRGLSLDTSMIGQVRTKSDTVPMNDQGYRVHLYPPNISSHAEQVVYICGAVAVATADQFTQ